MAGAWGEITNTVGVGTTNVFSLDDADPSGFFRVRARRN